MSRAQPKAGKVRALDFPPPPLLPLYPLYTRSTSSLIPCTNSNMFFQLTHQSLHIMNLKLYRKQNTPTYCLGHLYLKFLSDEFFFCDTIEPPVRPAEEFIRGNTAVPAATYSLALTQSPKFNRLLPLLVNVPNMSGIRIHRGNSSADTRGCILPGRYIGHGRLAESTPREQDLVRLMQESSLPSSLEIINDFNASPATNNADEPVHYAATFPLSALLAPLDWLHLKQIFA